MFKSDLHVFESLPVVSKNQQRMPASVRLLGPTSSMPITKQDASIPAIEKPVRVRALTKLKMKKFSVNLTIIE